MSEQMHRHPPLRAELIAGYDDADEARSGFVADAEPHWAEEKPPGDWAQDPSPVMDVSPALAKFAKRHEGWTTERQVTIAHHDGCCELGE